MLYLLKILERETDEQHPITTNELIERLAFHDITAERKSLYADMECLRNFGYDINSVRNGNSYGYYIGCRDFELPELQLLVDSIQSSKFITQKKTRELISKLESLTNVHAAQQLQRQVYVKNRVKTMNESIYYTIDFISSAISANKAITFQYYEFSVSRKRVLKNNGKIYTVSPFSLIWDDENYYLLCFDHDAEIMKHFRVDKMDKINVLSEPRKGMDEFRKIDMSSYSKKVFGMFSGATESVKIRFANKLAGAVIDRFGLDNALIPDGDDHFVIRTDISVSPVFYGWLFGFGKDAEILSPAAVRQGMIDHIRETYAQYDSSEKD